MRSRNFIVLSMNRCTSDGERGRLGCTDRRLADLNNPVYRHGCSAGRRTQQAKRPRSPQNFWFMSAMCKLVRGGLTLCLAGWLANPTIVAAADSEAKTLYENNFEKNAVGTLPEEFLKMDGEFKVQQEGSNKFLELPGAPLDTFGLLFGPTEKDGITVQARILGTAKGRRFPAFGVGLNGWGGYKLQVSPAKKSIELFRGETLRKSVAHNWPSGTWTHLRLTIQKSKDGGWYVAGKVWSAGEQEPETPSISIEEKEEPPPGRASISGMPYSGEAIRFDDLKVTVAQ